MKYYQKKRISKLLDYQRRKEKDRNRKLIKEIVAENFLNLGRDLNSHVHESHGSPNKLNLERSSTI